MIRGLYTGALSMTAQMNKMDVVANNIANVDTTGYKKDSVITQSFTDELTKRINTNNSPLSIDPNIGGLSMGVYVQNIYTDFTNGSLRNVSDPLAVSLDGDGFFCINYTDNNGNVSEMYTRDGSFTLSQNNMLVTKEGYPVLTNTGTVTIPDGEIQIDSEGNIIADGQVIAKLRLIDFSNKESLTKTGDNIYRSSDESNVIPTNSKIVQGFLESSNVNSVTEMVEMINLSRAYEANQRVITTIDQTLSRAVNDIARK